MSDYEQTYTRFWQHLVENPDGSLNRDAVQRELADYQFLIGQVPIVYDEVTGGRVSDPRAMGHAVISIFQERLQQTLDEAVVEQFRELAETVEEKAETAAAAVALIRKTAEELAQQCGLAAREATSTAMVTCQPRKELP
jgi:hypothetical protein